MEIQRNASRIRRMKKTHSIFFVLIILVATASIGVFFQQQQQSAQQNTLSQFNPIQQENQLPGTTAWQLTNAAQPDLKTFRTPAIEGYAWATSAIAGDTLAFSVSTTAHTFTADIYRLGWYQGNGGRHIQSITNLQGNFYPMPSIDAQSGLVAANWPIAFTIKISPKWVSGIYIAKLTAATGEQCSIPFVVRSNRKSDFVLIHADTTDEAYNNWGGKSLYSYNSLGGQAAFKVSFDRPFLSLNGLAYLLTWEYPMIRWLEYNGYDVTYLSTTDVETHPSLLRNHHGVLIVGHNEYWSKLMRDNLEAAINTGVNLANFAANTMVWQIRYEPRTSRSQPQPQRIIVCYKNKILDPLYGKDNSLVTVDFRSALLNRPEQAFLGSMWAGDFNWGTSYNWVVADASNWVFANTGLQNGDSLLGLVGYEYDHVFANFPTPPGETILSTSPVHNVVTNKDDVSNATVYTAKSGARVFDAATNQWSWGLDGYNNTNLVNPSAQKITQNILANFLTVSSTPQL